MAVRINEVVSEVGIFDPADLITPGFLDEVARRLERRGRGGSREEELRRADRGLALREGG